MFLISVLSSLTKFLVFTAGMGVYNLGVSIITGMTINEAAGLQECHKIFASALVVSL